MRRPLLSIFAGLFTFAIALVVFGALSGRGGDGADARTAPAAAEITAGLSADERIEALQRLVRARQGGAPVATQLGDAYLQKARETADPTFYGQAEELFAQARRAAPQDPDPLIGLGTLALARHDFREALELAERARVLAPEIVRPYAVLVDAQVELGRYRDAGRSLQRMVDLKPNLASYARVSYFRELHGDLAGAVEAMRLAVSAGGDSPESVAYVQTLLGDLEFLRGRPRAAGAAYASALGRLPGYVPALASRARLDASQGRLDRAIKTLRSVTQRLPLPEYVIAQGEAELARGDRRAARDSFDLVRAERQLLSAAGVNTDVEFALFEADHGDRTRAVRLGRRAYQAAPSIASADALGWALSRAGRPREGLRYARRAVRLGTRDPLLLVHAGLIAKAAGRRDLAARWLRRAVAENPNFSPLWAPRARRALRSLAA